MSGGELAGLRDEVCDLRGLVAGFPEPLRDGVYAPYVTRLRALERELEDAELRAAVREFRYPAMDLRLSSSSLGVPVDVLGGVLGSWQLMLSAIAQALDGKPTARGAIPQKFVRATRLEAIAYASGSLITRMVLRGTEQGELYAETLGVRAFRRFQVLCDAGDDGVALKSIFGELRLRALSAYQRMLTLLDKHDVSMELVLLPAELADIARADLSLARARGIVQALKDIAAATTEETELELVGVLATASTRTGAFELDAGEPEGLYKGEGRADLFDGAVLGGRYRCRVVEVEGVNQITGDLETRLRLEGIEPA